MTQIILAATFFLFVFKANSFLDPDFGWHIKTGEYIANVAVPKTDIFSYTMPSYPWVDHEWLTNFLMFQGLNSIGYLGLAIVFSLIALAALLISVGIPNSLNKRIIFILTAGIIFPPFGIRPQVITWFFLALLTKFLFDKNFWQKFKFFLPIMFLAWANLHGAFASGIVIFAFFILFKTLRMGKPLWEEQLLLFLSTLATLVNPYGERVWKEVLTQFLDTPLYRRTIAEWGPSIFSGNIAFAFALPLSITLLIYLRKKIPLETKMTLLALAYQAFSTIRHIPIFGIISAPLTITQLELFDNQLTKNKESRRRLKIAQRGLLIIAAIVSLTTAVFEIETIRTLNEEKFYPKGAIEFLRQYKKEGRILNWFGFGGYLIWKYPEEKVFIDGRMPSMKWKENPDEELPWAFDTYNNISKLDGDISQIEKFNIRYLLVQNKEFSEDDSQFKLLLQNFLEMFFDSDNSSNLVSNLTRNGNWVVIYEDEASRVYELAKD